MSKNELNSEQLEAVTYDDGPLLVLAGAGSGKTRVLTYRVAYLITEKGVAAENILLLTFTNKAAGEMTKRVKELTGVNPGFGGTFHSFCARILRKYGYFIGIDPGFTIYDEDDRMSAIKMAMKELNLDPKIIKAPSVAAGISNAKNEMMDASGYAKIARGAYQEAVAQIWQKYEDNLRKFHSLDFDDLLIWGVRLLQSERGKKRLQEQYSHVLIDEYQDTNKVQYVLTKLLVDNQEKPELTVVGDFSQSIYSWRGADYRNLMALERDFPMIKMVKLETNYRSTQNILDAAYGVIGNNTEHPILELKATSESGERIYLFEAKDEKDEARFIIKTINGNPLNKFAVLYRTNAQSRAIEEELIRNSLPYVLVGGTKFYERKEVKDVLAYLRVIANPEDQVSWQRIDGVGKRRRESFEKWLAGVKDEGKKAAEVETGKLLEGVLYSTEYLSLYDEEDENDLMRLENIKELLTVAQEFPDLTAFLENVALVQNEATANVNQGDNKITLMTIHAAKGLEFDEVFIVGMEEGLFPHSRTLMDRMEMEEERRLCYVAITRAKKRLYLSFARNRLYFGQRESGTPSRFLMEVPERLLLKMGFEIKPAAVEKTSGGRKIVQDWEVDAATRSDFDEIDSWGK